jgi:hypothetical protein
VLIALSPHETVHLLYTLATHIPAAVQSLLSPPALTPLAAYLLTRTLESADEEGVFMGFTAESSKEDDMATDNQCSALAITAEEFYGSFYGAAGEASKVCSPCHLRNARSLRMLAQVKR